MKTLIIADSLAMPRNENEDIVYWEDTWPSKIREFDHTIEIVNLARRARMINSLNETSLFDEYIRFFQPDIIIMQIGIVDSMPRIISLREKGLLNLSFRSHRLIPRNIRDNYISWKSKRRSKITGKNPLAKVYTQPIKFKQYILSFVQKVDTYFKGNVRFIIVPILMNDGYMEEKSPGAISNRALYNSFFKELRVYSNVYLIDENIFDLESPEVVFCSDGYQLSKTGNSLLAYHICKTF